MAEPISIQQLKDASEDAISLAEFINKPANVMIPRRLAADINSLQYYLDYMSSYAQHSYETYDEMVANAVNLPNGVSVFVTNDLDTAKNGIYTYNGISFVKGDYQPENAAKDYVEAKLGGLQIFDGKVRAQDVSTVYSDSQESLNFQILNRQKHLNVDSVLDMIALQAEESQVVFVRGLQGGTFVYDSSKSLLNDGGVVFNGWVRYGVSKLVTPQMFGAKGEGTTGDQECITKALTYLNSIGGGTLYIPDGLYLIDTVHYVKESETGASLNEQYAFAIYSNITVQGQSKGNTIFKMADGIIYKKLTEANIGCALFADAHRRVHIENFKLTNFKVDMNGINNPVIDLPTTGGGGSWESAQQAIFPVLYFFDYYTSYNIEVDGIWVHQNSGLNSIYVGHKSTYTTIKNCLFTDHSDFIVGNEAIKDHSTIYIAGLDNKIHDNVFLMNHNPVSNVEPTRFSTVSTAIEAHGVNTVVSNNIVDGYGAPFLAASTEWYNGDRVIFTGNIASNAIIGFAWNTMNGNLHATFEGNYVSLRKQKASTADNYLRYAHSAVESMGAINSVFDYSTAYGDIFIKNNVFVQTPASDWSPQDNTINVCMNVKEARIFEATGNTFVNFKGAVYTTLAHRDWLNAKHTLKSNTYINCGENTDYSLYRGAYTLSNGNFATERDYTFNLLESISISDETFVDCKYGVLLVKQGDLTAKTISLTDIKYLSGFIVPMMVAKDVLVTANHTVNIEYTTTGVPDATQSLPNIVGLTAKLKMSRWSDVTDTYLLNQIEYTKPAYYGWNVYGYGIAPTVGVQYGAFPNVSGDIVDLKTPTLNGFSRYTFFEGSWYGTGKIEAANKLL